MGDVPSILHQSVLKVISNFLIPKEIPLCSSKVPQNHSQKRMRNEVSQSFRIFFDSNASSLEANPSAKSFKNRFTKREAQIVPLYFSLTKSTIPTGYNYFVEERWFTIWEQSKKSLSEGNGSHSPWNQPAFRGASAIFESLQRWSPSTWSIQRSLLLLKCSM